MEPATSDGEVQGVLIQIGDEPPHERLWLHEGVLYTLEALGGKRIEKLVLRVATWRQGAQA